MIRPIHDGIFFIFLDKNHRGNFQEVTDWGFEHSDSKNKKGYDDQSGRARWAKVVALGHEVDRDEIPLSSYICIEPLMWTNSFSCTDSDGSSYNIWKTDPDKILMVSQDYPQ